MLQLPPANYQFQVTARCTYENSSQPSSLVNYDLSVGTTNPDSTGIGTDTTTTQDTSTTYTVDAGGTPDPPATYTPEPTPEPAIDILNTPIRIVYDTSTLPDAIKTNLPSGGVAVLPDNPSTEQLKAAVKSQTVTCASIIANYSCGNADYPGVPAGDIIQPAAGDQIAINSIGFEVVTLDVSGNGTGIVKVPMFNNAKLGVEFQNIKVAKGGCVVSGQAVLSHVDVALLSEQQRTELAKIYEAYNKALDIADAFAPEIAETYNNFADMLGGLKSKAQAIANKISSGGKPSKAEVAALQKLTEQANSQMQASLDAMKKSYGEQISQEQAAHIDSMTAQNKINIAELTKFKSDSTANIATSVQTLAAIDPAEVEKTIKDLSPLMISYNSKKYGDSKTISVNYSKLDETFYLENGEDNTETQWQLKSGDEVIKSFAITTKSIAINFSEFDADKLEIYHTQGMYFEITQGTRKIKVNITTQQLVLEKITIADANHPSRTATTGQTLYLVGEGNIKANVSATGFTNPFTNPNLSWSVIQEGQSSPQDTYATKSIFTNDFGANPVGIDESTYTIEALNALGEDKSVNVKIVDENGEKQKLTIGSETFGETIKKALELEKTISKTADQLEDLPFIKRTKSKFESAGGKIAFYYNAIPFEQTEINKEDKGSRLYYRERKIKGGFEAGIKGEWKYPVWGIPFDKLPLPQSAIDWCKSYVTAEVNIKGKADAGGEINVQQTDKKWVESTNWELGTPSINPAQIRLKVEFGAEAEVSVLKKSDLFSVVANASGMVKTELLSFGYYTDHWAFVPLRDGVNLELTAGGYITWMGFKYETNPYYQKINIVKPNPFNN